MRYLIIIILLLSKTVIALPLVEANFMMDTIPPPPGSASYISGPSESCVGNTSIYTSDIPLGCYANWYINGILQSELSGTLEVIWTEMGSFNINLDFECDTSIFPADSILVIVSDVPGMPEPIQGETSVCIMSTSTYTTEVEDGESCIWIVDGIVQISDSTMMSYYWSEMGLYIIEVSAVNECGEGDAEYLDVMVNELPIVNLGNDTTILGGELLTLDAGNPGCTYQWSTGETTKTIVVTQSGNYEVIVSNACGDVSDDIYVDVLVGIYNPIDKVELFVRIENDRLYIEVSKSDIVSIQIWDIMGRLILESQSKPFYFISQKGTFIIKAITTDSDVVSCRFSN